MKVGFIGLGNMGAPMARNLAKAGHDVQGFDPVARMPDGVSSAATAVEAAAYGKVVITMLPNDEIVLDVARQIMPAMRRGTILLDCSTVTVDAACQLAARATQGGLDAIDAPVSGGIAGAAAGSLTFMVGGSKDALETVTPLLDIMGGRIVHCGSNGAGQAAKICNNMILGATMAVTCEAFALADGLGLDREKLFDVVSTSSGSSWSMNSYCPAPGVGPVSPSDNNYLPGFAAELMLKDLRLSQHAAEAVGAMTPLGARAMELYSEFVEQANGRGRDFSALLPFFTDRKRG
ncbi:3-hydroxyisobutyrate dehydrogenase [Qingshengfaniella alkalisoli]|uniref:3-hydroxyisobutyrate dehydrogenase n=1 Tax=Qingshengfaniella alkalisoli TaxID=2599296 RepID=A0A5B8J3C8_9RHOB|nr:3-hydroxyisobutyrate dehydrogenase [Qingshengfaniella alkalisoli]QDY71228.1 3-hydroxyisobutyrate dehydrogenase [Qingshengfaniella alkalisoli]